MKIIVFTTKDFVYSNYVLNNIIRSGVFAPSDELIVLEQDHLIPGKTKWQALARYIKKSGWHYVTAQIFKKSLFLAARAWYRINGDVEHPYYPYYKQIGVQITRKTPFNYMKTEEHTKYIRSLEPDLIISTSSMEIIPEKIISIPRFGVINTHPALLPKYRGVSPVLRALTHQDTHVGMTLHYIDVGIDTGAIIGQKRLVIGARETEHHLSMRTMKAGASMIVGFIRKLKARQPIITSANPKEGGSYFSIPKKKELRQLRKLKRRFFHLRDYFSQPDW